MVCYTRITPLTEQKATTDMKQLPFFVYGTLRSGFDRFDLLDLRTDHITDGIVKGASMYKMTKTDYPMAVLDNSPNAIYGELMFVKPTQYDVVMEALDAVEGYSGDDDRDLFTRTTIKVLDPEDNTETEAWVYVAGKNLVALCENDAERIEEGDWEVYVTRTMDAADFDDFDDESIEATLAREDDEIASGTYTPSGSISYRPSQSYSTVQPAKKSGYTTKPTYYVDKAKDTDAFVWYVSYGSNLNVDRFLKYLNVGRHTEAEKFTAEDIDSIQVQVPHGIYFAKSGRWGSGGIAFLDVDTVEDFTCAVRAYKLTIQQFWSLVCQENGSRSITLDWNKMQDERNYDAPQSGLYSRIVNLGMIEGIPAFTVTNPESYASMLSKEKTPVPYQFLELGMLNPPSREYLNTINEGAEQTALLPAVDLVVFKPKSKSKTETKKPTSTKSVKSTVKKDSTKAPASSNVVPLRKKEVAKTG